MTLTSPIDLSGSVCAYVEFYAKWALETNYDYVQLLVSNDMGQSWIPLESAHTSLGTAFQDPGKPLYHGFNNECVLQNELKQSRNVISVSHLSNGLYIVKWGNERVSKVLKY